MVITNSRVMFNLSYIYPWNVSLETDCSISLSFKRFQVELGAKSNVIGLEVVKVVQESLISGGTS